MNITLQHGGWLRVEMILAALVAYRSRLQQADKNSFQPPV